MVIKRMPIALLFLTIISCTNPSQKNKKDADTTRQEKPMITDAPLSTPRDLSNKNFRKELKSWITNQKDLNKFDTLLTVLDRQGISFCQFVEGLYKLDDSCYAVARRKFPAPSQQNDFSLVHDKAIVKAEKAYLTRLKIRKDLSSFAVTAYNFDERIKGFCGKY